MKIIKVICVIIFIQAIGCVESGESYTFGGKYYELSGLYYQRIPNSTKILYEFSAWSKYNDSYVGGMIIFDSTEVVEMSRINEELPFDYLVELPNDTIIRGVKLVKSTDKFNVKERERNHFFISREGIKIDVIEKEKYGLYSTVNCNLQEYNFEDVYERRDSLYFKGISTNRKHLPKLEKGIAFKKGNIYLDYNDQGFISKLTVKQIIEEQGTMFKYKHASRELEEEIENQFVRCVRTYYFKPIKKIKENTLSEFGLFRSITCR
ncbi:MAG: hypothetical protein ACI85O_001499 [Saprospiraceae bacterium]|jgi:hypothetical protein